MRKIEKAYDMEPAENLEIDCTVCPTTSPNSVCILPANKIHVIDSEICRQGKDPCEGRRNANKFIVGMVDFIKEIYNQVTIIKRLENDDYDKLLTQNVVFLKLIDASACNTVIECIARNTPLIINRIPATVEYLGSDYPLFWSTYEEATKLIEDDEKLLAGHNYLKTRDKTYLTVENLVESLKTQIVDTIC